MTRIIPRSEWHARADKNGADVSSRLPWGEVCIHTEAGPDRRPGSLSHEAQAMRNIEAFHIGPERGWNGIAYSFVIFPSGRIFEGRGWGRSGAHTEGRNSTAAGVCFAGHGDKSAATPEAVSACRWLIGEGIRLGRLRPSPLITGHRQYTTKGKSCPGDRIWAQLDRFRGIGAPTSPPAAAPRPNAPSEPRPPLPKETFLMALTDSEQKALAGDARGALAAAFRAEAQATQARAAAQRADLRTEHITALLQKVLTGDSFDAKQAKLFDARVRKELAEVSDRLEAELAALNARHDDAK
jgi:peptidoglycan recognition protein